MLLDDEKLHIISDPKLLQYNLNCIKTHIEKMDKNIPKCLNVATMG